MVVDIINQVLNFGVPALCDHCRTVAIDSSPQRHRSVQR